MPNEFSPRSAAQPLKPRELRRIQRNAMPAVDRAALWPIDAFEYGRQMRRELFLLDCALGVMWGIIVLCLIGVVMGL